MTAGSLRRLGYGLAAMFAPRFMAGRYAPAEPESVMSLRGLGGQYIGVAVFTLLAARSSDLARPALLLDQKGGGDPTAVGGVALRPWVSRRGPGRLSTSSPSPAFEPPDAVGGAPGASGSRLNAALLHLPQSSSAPMNHLGVDRYRFEDVRAFIAALRMFAHAQSDPRAVALVGSYAQGSQAPNSDVDIVALSTRPARYIDDDERIERFPGRDRSRRGVEAH